jgi:mannosyl-3-phosphoglycerate phosphatase
MDWLIVTDLDGTLLDDRYPVREASLAVDIVADSYPGARIALASSKTLTEMIELAGHCVCDPFLVFENGAGIAWRESVLARPGSTRVQGYEVECAGEGYEELRVTLQKLQRSRRYKFRGFGDMSAAEVAHRTGLDERAAADARLRMASEPIVWNGDEQSLECFRSDLDELGLHLESGGRFYHVLSSMNKARALGRIKRLIRYQTGIQLTTLACGDAPNDLEMLQRADHALVFPMRSGGYLLPERDGVAHAPRAGPGAWLAGVTEVIAGVGGEISTAPAA